MTDKRNKPSKPSKPKLMFVESRWIVFANKNPYPSVERIIINEIKKK
jgi:hypothetical protein